MWNWNAFSTDGTVGVTAEITTFEANGRELHAYVARPPSAGPLPGIVLVHHLPGWDEFYEEFAERLAKHGHIVTVPDLYCRFGHGSPDEVATKARSEGGPSDDAVVSDLGAAREWLLAQPGSNGKVGIVGSCSGGRHALLAASRIPGFDAVVDLWGAQAMMTPEQLSEARPVAPVDYTEQLQTPLLGIFGNEDQGPSPEEVDAHEEVLKRHGKTYEFYRFDSAGHGFIYYHNSRYRPTQAMEAWDRMFTFLGAHL